MAPFYKGQGAPWLLLLLLLVCSGFEPLVTATPIDLDVSSLDRVKSWTATFYLGSEKTGKAARVRFSEGIIHDMVGPARCSPGGTNCFSTSKCPGEENLKKCVSVSFVDEKGGNVGNVHLRNAQPHLQVSEFVEVSKGFYRLGVKASFLVDATWMDGEISSIPTTVILQDLSKLTLQISRNEKTLSTSIVIQKGLLYYNSSKDVICHDGQNTGCFGTQRCSAVYAEGSCIDMTYFDELGRSVSSFRLRGTLPLLIYEKSLLVVPGGTSLGNLVIGAEVRIKLYSNADVEKEALKISQQKQQTNSFEDYLAFRQQQHTTSYPGSGYGAYIPKIDDLKPFSSFGVQQGAQSAPMHPNITNNDFFNSDAANSIYPHGEYIHYPYSTDVQPFNNANPNAVADNNANNLYTQHF